MIEEALLIDFVVKRVDKDRNTIEAQAFAFVVKVEIGVMYFRVCKDRNRLFESLLDWFFISFLVDKIDCVNISVNGVKIFEMPS